MSTVTRLVLGIIIGVLASLMTLAIAQIGVNLLMGLPTVGRTVMMITLLSGALLGVISVGLGYLTAGIERSVLVVLIGVAVAALVVLVGGYGSGSILPVGIYGLALVNSLMISRVTAVLGEPANQSTRLPPLPGSATGTRGGRHPPLCRPQLHPLRRRPDGSVLIHAERNFSAQIP